MSQISRQDFKNKYIKGYKPTVQDWANHFDSYFNLQDDKVTFQYLHPDVIEWVNEKANQSDLDALALEISGKQDISEKGSENGYCPLDEDGYVPRWHLKIGSVDFVNMGAFNPNTDTLPYPEDSLAGNYYRVSEDGAVSYYDDEGAIIALGDASIGDVIICNTDNSWTIFETNLNLASTDNLPEGIINLYFTNQRAIDAVQELLDDKADAIDLDNHTSNTNNPHQVTKSQVGLSNVNNTSDADKPISNATQTALDTKAQLDKPDQEGDIYATQTITDFIPDVIRDKEINDPNYVQGYKNPSLNQIDCSGKIFNNNSDVNFNFGYNNLNPEIETNLLRTKGINDRWCINFSRKVGYTGSARVKMSTGEVSAGKRISMVLELIAPIDVEYAIDFLTSSYAVATTHIKCINKPDRYRYGRFTPVSTADRHIGIGTGKMQYFAVEAVFPDTLESKIYPVIYLHQDAPDNSVIELYKWGCFDMDASIWDTILDTRELAKNFFGACAVYGNGGDSQFERGNNGFSVWGAGTVITRKIDETGYAPSKFKNILEITTGNNQTTAGKGGIARNGGDVSNTKIGFIVRAKIPVGENCRFTNDPLGTGGRLEVVGSTMGTGEYENYACIYHLGVGASSRATAYFTINNRVDEDGNDTGSVTFQVAMAEVFDLTKPVTDMMASVDLNNVVTLNTTQTITGKKDFTVANRPTLEGVNLVTVDEITEALEARVSIDGSSIMTGALVTPQVISDFIPDVIRDKKSEYDGYGSFENPLFNALQVGGKVMNGFEDINFKNGFNNSYAWGDFDAERLQNNDGRYHIKLTRNRENVNDMQLRYYIGNSDYLVESRGKRFMLLCKILVPEGVSYIVDMTGGGDRKYINLDKSELLEGDFWYIKGTGTIQNIAIEILLPDIIAPNPNGFLGLIKLRGATTPIGTSIEVHQWAIIDMDESIWDNFLDARVLSTNFFGACAVYGNGGDSQFERGNNGFNSYGTGVSLNRITDNTAPSYNKNILEITTGLNDVTSMNTKGGLFRTHSDKPFTKIGFSVRAKIPIGESARFNSNTLGNGGRIQIIGSLLGTGDYENYTCIYHLGNTPGITTTSYFAIANSNLIDVDGNPIPDYPVTFQVAMAEVFDLTKPVTDMMASKTDLEILQEKYDALEQRFLKLESNYSN